MVDDQVLAEFSAEVTSLVPAITDALTRALAEGGSRDDVHDAYRYVHTIKGAAALVGLTTLSHLADQVESILDTESESAQPLTPEVVDVVTAAALGFGLYVEALMAGEPTDPVTTAIDAELRRFRGLPAAPAESSADAHVRLPAAPAKPAAAPELDTDIEVRASIAVASELADVFQEEAREHLQTISTVVGQLRTSPDDRDALQELRRSVHTLKGAAGMVGFKAVGRLAHRMEDLLDQLYEGTAELSQAALEALFGAADAFDDLIRETEDHEGLRRRVVDLYGRFDDLLKASSAAPAPSTVPAASAEAAQVELPAAVLPVVSPEATAPPAAAPAVVRRDQAVAAPAKKKPADERRRTPRRKTVRRTVDQVVRVPFDRLDDVVKLISELVINRSTFEQHFTGLKRQLEELALSTGRLRRVASKLESQYEVRALATQVLQGPSSGPAGPRLATHATHGFDELEFDRYTEFHLLSRELTETASDINTVTARLRDNITDFDGDLTRLGRLTGEVQDKVMQFRMLPLATLATQLERTVRVTATDRGKLAQLALEGSDVALDKAVLEEMSDPLLHMLRNSVDHGIEAPDVRRASGKPEQGRVVVRALYEGTQVVIQIQDDGAGLDVERIRAGAVSRGIVSADAAQGLSDQEVFGFIFAPGFSTAREVSQISGRGVGMDIVRSKVERLKGQIRIDSTPGQGTTFTVRLPMTLAISRVLLVRAGTQSFALPMGAVLSIVKRSQSEISRVGSESVVCVDDRHYPVLALAEAIGAHGGDAASDSRPLLILNAAERHVAVAVDEILESRDVVVKNLGGHLRRVHGFSGATLLGDGSVVLIVNPEDLLRPSAAPRVSRTSAVTRAADRSPFTVMVVDDSLSVRHVLSNLVSRAGWNVTQARDGVEALEILHRSERNPDVILMDIEMPRMDGYELTSTLRAQSQSRDIPIIMITSRAGDKHRQKAMALGATEYMVKPFQDDVLLQRIDALARAARSKEVAA